MVITIAADVKSRVSVTGGNHVLTLHIAYFDGGLRNLSVISLPA